MIEAHSQDCSVCLQPIINPIDLPCGHTYCFLCIKGVANANISQTCALCRKPFSREIVDKPNVLATEANDNESVRHVWYYEGRNGWWLYDQRTNEEIDEAFRNNERCVQILLVGHIYVIDFETMQQYRLDENYRRRRIKYDLLSAPKKGIAGLKLDPNRDNSFNRSISCEAPIPLPAINNLAPNSSALNRSRSVGDGEEPTIRSSVLSNPIIANNSVINDNVRGPADGLGQPNRNLSSWRARNREGDIRPSISNDNARNSNDGSDDGHDDEHDRIPLVARQHPVLGGENDDQDLMLNNLFLD